MCGDQQPGLVVLGLAGKGRLREVERLLGHLPQPGDLRQADPRARVLCRLAGQPPSRVPINVTFQTAFVEIADSSLKSSADGTD